jgi:hypothetical protein
MQAEYSLPCLQGPDPGPYPRQMNLVHTYIPDLFKIIFNNVHCIYANLIHVVPGPEESNSHTHIPCLFGDISAPDTMPLGRTGNGEITLRAAFTSSIDDGAPTLLYSTVLILKKWTKDVIVQGVGRASLPF